jgi:diguanylate cyclase
MFFGNADTEQLDSGYRAEVRIDKLKLLYRQSSHSVLTILVAGCLWAAVVWFQAGETTKTALSYWLFALALTSAIRVALFWTYRRANPEGEAVLRWQNPYLFTFVLSPLVFGVGTLLVVPMDSTLLLLVTYVFLIGMAGAALASFGVFIGLTVVGVSILLLPILVLLVAKGETLTMLLAIAGFGFLVTTMRGLSIHNSTVDESFRLSHQLRETTRIAQQQAQTDWLTGLRNRRAFVETAEAVLSLVAREQYPATMMLIDIDGFKDINDNYGHAAGDAALAHLAGLLTETLRRSDVCGRLGGDEFAVLLPRTMVDGARGVAYKLCKLAASQIINHDGNLISITLSIGLAAGPGDCEVLLQRADEAMYTAKRAGKNQFAEA